MNFFALGLEKATIYANREWGKAEVKFWSFVADQQFSLPQADDILSASKKEEKRTIVRELIPSFLTRWEGITIGHIPDRHTFVFGDTGRILYRAKKIPLTLDWIMFVIEDDTDIRTLGEQLGTFFTDEKVDTIAAAITTLAGLTATPAVAAGIVLAKELIRGVSFVLKKNENDQLGVVEESFIRPRDYPTGTRHGVGVADLSGNMWYDYFIYGIEEEEEES